jgi:hypothetical protein
MSGGSVGVEHRTLLRSLVLGGDARAMSVLRDIFVGELESLPMKKFGDGALVHRSGIYALYYLDPEHPVYARTDPMTPVYVGQATSHLGSRVASLMQSIKQTALHVESCRVRVLPVDDCFISCAERLLLEHFKPLWNCVLTGIGNHAPGKGRTAQVRSDWDTLHPGRPWALVLPPSPHTTEQLLANVAHHLAH